MDESTQRNREEVDRIAFEFGSRASVMKLYSHLGAVRVPAEHRVPPTWIVYDDGVNKYIEPGNQIYADVLNESWPEAVPWLNNESKGDVIESLLGWRFLVDQRGFDVDFQALDMVKMLETACWLRYASDYWSRA